MSTLRDGKFIDEEGDRIGRLFDNKLFEKIFEKIIDMFFTKIIFDASLILQFLLFIHLSYIYIQKGSLYRVNDLGSSLQSN